MKQSLVSMTSVFSNFFKLLFYTNRVLTMIYRDKSCVIKAVS